VQFLETQITIQVRKKKTRKKPAAPIWQLGRKTSGLGNKRDQGVTTRGKSAKKKPENDSCYQFVKHHENTGGELKQSCASAMAPGFVRRTPGGKLKGVGRGPGRVSQCPPRVTKI